MNSGRTVFAQLIGHLPHKEFHKCVARYRGDRYAKNFSCWDQYLAMTFAQPTYRESLRDIETCLGAVGGKLYHRGWRTSGNAVKTQIWIAVSGCVLVAIVRKRLGLEASLYQILQILSLTLFEKTPILCALQTIGLDANFTENVDQLILFEF
jgi:hypothetical protein